MNCITKHDLLAWTQTRISAARVAVTVTIPTVVAMSNRPGQSQGWGPSGDTLKASKSYGRNDLSSIVPATTVRDEVEHEVDEKRLKEPKNGHWRAIRL